MALEKPQYTVVGTTGEVEFRRYTPYLVAETVVADEADFAAAGDEGFNRLFRYISGGNRSQSKISMTVPVGQEAATTALPKSASKGDKIAMTAPVGQTAAPEGWRVTFMLPNRYTRETAPIPADARVRIVEEPGQLMAVLRYSGRWTERNYAEKRERLLRALDAADVQPRSDPVLARYDPPFKPPFLRRNEVMVVVDRVPL